MSEPLELRFGVYIRELDLEMLQWLKQTFSHQVAKDDHYKELWAFRCKQIDLEIERREVLAMYKED